MARVRLNPALESFQGEVGDLVFVKRYGRTYALRKPDDGYRQSSDAQKAVRRRFRLAAVYAKEVMANAEAREAYDIAAKEREMPVQNVIVADFLNAPSVDQIDLRGFVGQANSKIRVRASDDFDVTGVSMTISDDGGRIIEQGPAVLSSMNWGWWIYTTTTFVPAGTHIRLEATATDRPGNTGTKSEELVV